MNTEVTFIVRTTWVGRTPDEPVSEDEVVKLVAEYLAGTESPFCEDFRVGAAGGYEGPYVAAIEVDVA